LTLSTYVWNLRDKQWLRVYEKRILRRIFGPSRK
jgi:hypothetical protein